MLSYEVVVDIAGVSGLHKPTQKVSKTYFIDGQLANPS
jgi:hypothetical protein